MSCEHPVGCQNVPRNHPNHHNRRVTQQGQCWCECHASSTDAWKESMSVLMNQQAGAQSDITAQRGSDFDEQCVQCKSPKGEHQADTWFCPDYAVEGDGLSILLGFRSSRFISREVHPYNQTPAPTPPTDDELAALEIKRSNMSGPRENYIWGTPRDASFQLVSRDEAPDLIDTEISTPFALCIANDGGGFVIEGELPQLLAWTERLHGHLQRRWDQMVGS